MADAVEVELRLRFEDRGVRGRLESIRRGMRAFERDGSQATRALVRGFQRASEATVSLDRQMQGLRRTLLGLASAAAAIRLGRGIAQAALDMESLERALATVTGSAAAAGRELVFVRDVSARLGLDLETSVRQFAALAAAARGTSLAGAGVRQIFEAVAQAATVLGLSSDQLGGALTAIQQIISKGNVSAEELRQQLGERLPGAFQIAARAMGVTTQELNRMLERGELLATDFLPRFAEALRREFAAGVPAATASARAAFERLRTALFELRVEIARSGFLDALTEGVRSLTEALSDPRLREGLQALSRGVGTATTALASGIKALSGEIRTLLELLVGGAILKGASKLVVALRKVGTAIKTLEGRAGLASAALRRVPWVGVAIGAGKLAAAYAEYRITLEEIRAEEQRRRRTLEAVIDQTAAYASEQVKAEAALRRMSAAEIAAYAERLDAARRYYEARRDLAAQVDPTGDAAISAAREARVRREALQRIRKILAERLEAEREFADRIRAIKDRELEAIRDSLAEQLRAYDRANERLRSLLDQRKAIEQRFAEARAALEEAQGEGTPGFMDLATLMAEIRRAGADQLFDEMLTKAERLREATVAAFREGLISRVDARFFLRQAEQLAGDALDALERRARDTLAKVQAQIEQLVAKAEFLKRIEIGYDEESAVASTESLRRRIQALLERNPLKWRVELVGPDQARVRADQLLGLERKAEGGLVLGPGTETSDSILARLSRGEFIVRAAAVRRYGLAFLEALNAMRLPRFAAGGLVPQVPALPGTLAGAGGATTNVTIVLDGARYGPLRTDPETADGLREALLRTALKQGGRG